MKKILYLLIGLALGFALGSPAAQAIEGIFAQRCTSPILLNGAPVEIEAYTINGHNYFKLRDIGKAVGFNVYWIAEDRTVQIETGQPYTGEAPIRTEDVESDLQSEPNASTVDVDFMKQDIVERTNALRAERGIASLMSPLQSRTSLTAPMPCVKKMALLCCASTTSSCRRRRCARMRWRQTPSTPIPARTGENTPRSRTANMSAKTFIALQTGRCRTKLYQKLPCGHGIVQRGIRTTSLTKPMLRSA